MQLSDFLKFTSIQFKIHSEEFEIRLCEAADTPERPFADIFDAEERTVVRAMGPGDEPYSGRRYRMITFLSELPMDLVGFLSAVSTALAEKEIPLFVISSYRTDHVLVLEQDLEATVKALKSCGFTLRR